VKQKNLVRQSLACIGAVLLVCLAATGSAQSSQTAHRFADLNWLSSQRGWALVSTPCANGAGRCTGVYATRNGGRTWNRLTRANAFGCARLSTCVTHLLFVTSRIGYLYGHASFLTTDGGRTWKPAPGPQVESLVFSRGSVFRLVYQGTGCPGPCQVAIQRSRPGARTWRTLGHWPNTLGYGEQLYAGGGNLYVVFLGHIAGGQPSAHARIDISRNNGGTWTTRRDPCGGVGAREADAVAASAAGRLFAVLCVARRGGTRTFTALSRDAGRTFGKGASFRMTAASQVAVGAAARIAVGNAGVTGGGSFGYELAVSSTRGRSWRAAIRDREHLAQDLEGGSLQLVGAREVSWVGSPYFAWQSFDGGTSWRKLRAP